MDFKAILLYLTTHVVDSGVILKLQGYSIKQKMGMIV